MDKPEQLGRLQGQGPGPGAGPFMDLAARRGPGEWFSVFQTVSSEGDAAQQVWMGDLSRMGSSGC